MKIKFDRVKAEKQISRKFAIQLVELWVRGRLEHYQEPARAGTPKGEPIGFFRKKYEAALWLALYPLCLKLQEVAKKAGVSTGVLRVWRTEEKFLELAKTESQRLGLLIAKTIESIIYSRYKNSGKDTAIEKPYYIIENMDPIDTVFLSVSALPLLNNYVMKPVIKMLEKHIDIDKESSDLPKSLFISLGLMLKKHIHVYDKKSLREWETRPETLELTKLEIARDIDLLANPQIWQAWSAEEVQDFAEVLKEFVMTKLDILAS